MTDTYILYGWIFALTKKERERDVYVLQVKSVKVYLFQVVTVF